MARKLVVGLKQVARAEDRLGQERQQEHQAEPPVAEERHDSPTRPSAAPSGPNDRTRTRASSTSRPPNAASGRICDV